MFSNVPDDVTDLKLNKRINIFFPSNKNSLCAIIQQKKKVLYRVSEVTLKNVILKSKIIAKKTVFFSVPTYLCTRSYGVEFGFLKKQDL